MIAICADIIIRPACTRSDSAALVPTDAVDILSGEFPRVA